MRLTVLATIQKAAAELGLSQPDTVVPSTETIANQLFALLAALCDELVRECDWSFLQSEYLFNTQVGIDTYAMPTDFQNIINSTEWNRSTRSELVGPINPSKWQQLKGSTIGNIQYSYRIKGKNLVITPVPASISQLALEYVSNYFVTDGISGLLKGTIDNNSDTVMFDDRLIINGLKLKFKEANGLNSVTAAYDYENLLASLKATDAGAAILSLCPSNKQSAANTPDGNWGQ